MEMIMRSFKIIALLMVLGMSVFCENQFVSVPQEYVEKTLVSKPLPQFTRKRIEYARSKRDEYLKLPLYNIVEGKKLTAKSGDPHDYISVGPYWWPNPETKDGLPYIRKDGIINPIYFDGDNMRMGKMTDVVMHLAILWYFDKDKEAASRAVGQLKVFFLDKSTRMNPNLNYGQAVPGVSDGLCFGLNETYNGLSPLLDAIIMLKNAPGMSSEIYASLVEWFRQFHQWLRTSPIGQSEFAALNNHGLACYVQAIKYALFIGDMEAAKAYMPRAEKLICESVEEDGSLPRELERTNSFTYSACAAAMMTQLVILGQMMDYDLMAPERKSAVAIRRAVLFLCQFIDNPKSWKHEQISPIDTNLLSTLLSRMAVATKDTAYLNNLKKLNNPKFDVMEELFLVSELNINLK